MIMQQYSKQMQQKAGSGTGVMETGDHFKNGASLKSLTSKTNLLFGVKRVFVLIAIALTCGISTGFGQFFDTQQLINQALNQSMEFYKNAENMEREYENTHRKRLVPMKVNESKSYFFRDGKGKYGAVIFLKGDVGIKQSGYVPDTKFAPTKVLYGPFDKEGITDITGNCIYMNDKILVPPMFTGTRYIISVYSFIGKDYLDHGYISPGALQQDKDVYEAYSDYTLLLNTYYNAMAPTYPVGMPTVPSAAPTPNNSSAKSATYEETCSMCNGKGWIPGSKTPTYGNTSTHWCSECNRNVSGSHSHDLCPSCGGKKTRTRIR
jgi:hypothetical protein